VAGAGGGVWFRRLGHEVEDHEVQGKGVAGAENVMGRTQSKEGEGMEGRLSRPKAWVARGCGGGIWCDGGNWILVAVAPIFRVSPCWGI
jgi:hypothetical protein